MTFLHILIASAIGLIAAGASALTDPAPNPNSMNLVKVGMIILMTCWLIILITAVVSLQQGVREHQRLTARRSGNAGTVGSREYEDGTVVRIYFFPFILPFTS